MNIATVKRHFPYKDAIGEEQQRWHMCNFLEGVGEHNPRLHFYHLPTS